MRQEEKKRKKGHKNKNKQSQIKLSLWCNLSKIGLYILCWLYIDICCEITYKYILLFCFLISMASLILSFLSLCTHFKNRNFSMIKIKKLFVPSLYCKLLPCYFFSLNTVFRPWWRTKYSSKRRLLMYIFE